MVKECIAEGERERESKQRVFEECERTGGIMEKECIAERSSHTMQTSATKEYIYIKVTLWNYTRFQLRFQAGHTNSIYVAIKMPLFKVETRKFRTKVYCM